MIQTVFKKRSFFGEMSNTVLCCILIPTRYTSHRVYFYLTTALHVSGITITHLQEHKTTVTIASGDRYTVLLSAAVVEEPELI
jgi:hypothetical protein